MKLRLIGTISLLGAVAGLGTGCGSASERFESDDPTYVESSGTSYGDAPNAGAQDAGSRAPEDSSKEAGRAIQEADVIKVVGQRLYALSRYGGLSIIDVSKRDHLSILGRYRMDATPFEMYVQGDVVYAMMSEYHRWYEGSWRSTSEVVALDTKDPAHIKELGAHDVPGSIADSRMVGDVLYLVTYRDGSCWRCVTNTPSTTVQSFHISPTKLDPIDQIDYSSAGYSYWKRSISVTQNRMYVAGPEWGGGYQPKGSVIQVIDISDPSGKMSKAAEVPVEGQIESRWQMDEYQGALRVISQPWPGRAQWSANIVYPRVQTFQVNSSYDIKPLAAIDLKIPVRESLESVRFDGPRGYAITVERKDPLFTIDLSDPKNPKQMGELKMPGWVYHMEPRGDRLIGLGFDNENANSLHVSLFDVSDLSKPTMIERVNFGDGWGQLAEDQDRIHKSFQVLDDAGLILVPFASYGRWWNESCTKGQSGIQLIDYSKDHIALRGVAPQEGQPRRAFLHDGRLFAMSDRHVTTFNVDDRQAPKKVTEIDLSTPAYRTASIGSHVAVLSNDWWTGEATLALLPKADAENAEILGRVSLKELAPSNEWQCAYGSNVWTSWYRAEIFPRGDGHIVVSVPVEWYGRGGSGAVLIVGVIDVRDPKKPVIVGRTAAALSSTSYGGYYGDYYGGYGYYGYGYGVTSAGENIVLAGSALAFIETNTKVTHVGGGFFGGSETVYETKRTLHVIDVTAANAPRESAALDLGDKSKGATPLLVQGQTILTTSWVPTSRGKARFFVDRVDVSNAGSPRKLTSVNVPGSLVHVDPESGRWVTVDYARKDGIDCGYYGSSRCVSYERSLNLVEVQGDGASRLSKLVPPKGITSAIGSGDRLYVTRAAQYSYDYASPGGYAARQIEGALYVLGGLRDGDLRILTTISGAYQYPVAVDGARLALTLNDGVGFYDTSADGSLRDIGYLKLRGWGSSNHVQIEGNLATVSLGEFGVQQLTLR